MALSLLHGLTPPGRVGEAVGLRLMIINATQTVLPAFSAFTGGQPLARHPGERLFACNGEAIVAL